MPKKPPTLIQLVLLLALVWLAPCGTAALADTGDGTCLPEFQLTNFQPLSPTYQQAVSSASYLDRTTLFALLSAG